MLLIFTKKTNPKQSSNFIKFVYLVTVIQYNMGQLFWTNDSYRPSITDRQTAAITRDLNPWPSRWMLLISFVCLPLIPVDDDLTTAIIHPDPLSSPISSFKTITFIWPLTIYDTIYKIKRYLIGYLNSQLLRLESEADGCATSFDFECIVPLYFHHCQKVCKTSFSAS